MIAKVLTHWVGAGTREDPRRPAVDDFDVRGWTDWTGRSGSDLPSPNLLVVQVDCTREVLDAIEADPDHGPDSILYESE